MKHIYTEPQFGQNWFGYEELYKQFVESAQSNDIIVEVGCWKGKSISYLGVEAVNSGKDIKIYAVDTWLGSDNEPDHIEDEYIKSGKLFTLFRENIQSLNNITPLQMTSLEASKKFEDASIYAVFIDADHRYNAVKEDIAVWYPKVKVGGFISGHDYGEGPAVPMRGVGQAVREFFGEQNITPGTANTWCHYKEES